MISPAPAPNYSCILLPSSTGLTNLEDFLTQCKAVATLSNWVALTLDPRPLFFPARLTDDALTFYRSSISTQKRSYDELKRLLRQQFKTNAKVLESQLKYFCQLPGQGVLVFYRTLRDFELKAFANHAVRNVLLLTTFIESLASSVARWKVRKAKPTVVGDTVSLAPETKSSLSLHGQQPDTSSPSGNDLISLSTSQSELFSDLFLTIKEKVKGTRTKKYASISAAVVNVLPAAERNNGSATTTVIEASAAIGTKPKEIAPIAKVVPPIEANDFIQWIEWVSTILQPTPRKNSNVAIVNIMTPKTVKLASNVGAWHIFGAIAAVDLNI